MTVVTTVKIPVKATIADHDTAPGIVNGVAEGDRIDVKMGGVLVASLAASSIDTNAASLLPIGTISAVAVTPSAFLDVPVLRDAVVGVPYDEKVSIETSLGQFLSETGFTLTPTGDSDLLPAGLTMALSDRGDQIEISGTPTTAGSAGIVVNVVSVPHGVTGQVNFVINVLAATLTLAAADLPGGTVGVAYSAEQLTAGGGTSVYTYTISGGGDPLPTGLSLNSGSGIISGTPTTAGSKSIVVTVTDSAGNVTNFSYNILIVAALKGQNNRAFTLQAVTTAGGEVRSAAIAIPTGAAGKLRIVTTQAITAGTPVLAQKLYVCATSGGTYVDSGVTLGGATGAAATDDAVAVATLTALISGTAAYVKLGCTVTGAAAAATETSDLSWVVPA